MAIHYSTQGFLPRSAMERRVLGLRDYSMPSEIRVYKVNPDGTAGELLRTERPQKRINNKAKEGKPK